MRPVRLQLTREMFEGAVEEAVGALPEVIRTALDRIPVLIAELPHPDDLKHADPPLSPLALGMFVTTVIGGEWDGVQDGQSAMILFKRNLERAADDRDALIDEIGHTIVHEVGHALGLSESELHELSNA